MDLVQCKFLHNMVIGKIIPICTKHTVYYVQIYIYIYIRIHISRHYYTEYISIHSVISVLYTCYTPYQCNGSILLTQKKNHQIWRISIVEHDDPYHLYPRLGKFFVQASRTIT